MPIPGFRLVVCLPHLRSGASCQWVDPAGLIRLSVQGDVAALETQMRCHENTARALRTSLNHLNRAARILGGTGWGGGVTVFPFLRQDSDAPGVALTCHLLEEVLLCVSGRRMLLVCSDTFKLHRRVDQRFSFVDELSRV